MRQLALLVALLGVALGLFVFLQRSVDSSGEAAGPGAEAEVVPDRPAAPELGERAGPDVIGSADAAERAAVAPVLAEGEGEPPAEEADGGGLERLTVVPASAEHGAWATFAEWTRLVGAEEIAAGRRLIEDWDPKAYRDLGAGPKARNDAVHGRQFRRPAVDEPALLLCGDVHDGLYASLELEPGAAGERELAPNLSACLELVAVDEGGAPVEARFALRLEAPPGTERARSSTFRGWEGRALVVYGTALQQAGWVGRPGTVTARSGLLQSSSLAITPDAWAPRGEPLRAPLELILQRGGRAELFVDRGLEGPPADSVLAIVTEADVVGPRTRSELTQEDGGASVRTKAVPIEFTGVPLGRPLSVWIGAEGQAMHGPFRVQGPGDAETPARWEVEVPPPAQVVRLRLVDEQGQPATGLDVFCSIEVVGGSRVSTQQTGDTAVLAFEGWKATEAERGVTVIRLSEEDGAQRTWLLEFDPPLGDGVHDLGDVRPLATSVLAAGRVVDAAGAPQPGARVRVARSPFEEDPNALLLERWLDGVNGGVCDAEGRFEITGTLHSGPLVLVANANGRVSDAQRVELGAAGVELVVRETGLLQLSHDPDQGSPQFVFALSGAGLAGQTFSVSAMESGRGHFSLTVPFGRYDMWVVRRRRLESGEFEEALLRRIDGLDVPPGGACEDPRLDPVVLD